MKKSYLQHRFSHVVGRLELIGLILAGASSAAWAQGLEQSLATFDTDIAAHTGTGGESANATAEWSSVNAGGDGSGSMKVTINWQANNGANWHEVQLNFNQSGIDATKWLNVEFDLKIDEPNSNLGPNGNYGFCQAVCQSWTGGLGWVELANTTVIQTNGWQHYTANLANFPGILNRLVLRLGSNGGQNVTNTVVYNIDNIKLTAPPLAPPTLGQLLPPTLPGLTLLPGAGGQYQRVMVYPNPNDTNNPAPPSTDFGWFGKATTASPVSYSFTIGDFPKMNDYAVNLFLIPNVHMQWGQGDIAGDWNSTNTLVLNITANTNNPATNWNVSFMTKTNLGGGNPNLTLVNFNYGELPNGKWTLAFNSDTAFTITAPNGFSTNGSLGTDVAELVSGNSAGSTALTPYFGTMPRVPAAIGVAATFSRIQIQGVPFPVDDTFATSPLDTNKWNRLADYPPGVFVSTGDLMHYLTWNTPNDQGFTSLVVGASPSGSWKEMGVESSKWLLVNGTREALIWKSAVSAALGGSETNAAFFRLIKRQFAKLQVLLPGETNAPGTATGKIGAPTAQQVGVPFDVVVNAVDADWYKIANVTDMVHLTSSDGLAGLPPSDTAMVGGTATITGLVSFGTAGSQTITAADATDAAKTANTSSAVSVTP